VHFRLLQAVALNITMIVGGIFIAIPTPSKAPASLSSAGCAVASSF
jgi:hypothetical protein